MTQSNRINSSVDDNHISRDSETVETVEDGRQIGDAVDVAFSNSVDENSPSSQPPPTLVVDVEMDDLSKELGRASVAADGEDGDDEEFEEDARKKPKRRMYGSRAMRINCYLLYISHLMSAVGDRMWNFCVPVTFILMFKGTLLPAALFTFVSKLATLIFASPIGWFVDTFERRLVVLVSLVMQNLCVVFCAVSLYFMFGFDEDERFSSAVFLVLFVVVLLLGGVAEIFSVASSVSVEKDWVCVMAGEKEDLLTTINGTIRRINLLALLCAPSVFGLFVDYLDKKFALVLVVAWNAVSFFPEAGLLMVIYYRVPELKKKHPVTPPLPSEDVSVQCDDVALEGVGEMGDVQKSTARYIRFDHNDEGEEVTPNPIQHESEQEEEDQSKIHVVEKEPTQNLSRWSKIKFQLSRVGVFRMIFGAKVYVTQPVFLASFSFCLLFFTIADFGVLMTAFMLDRWNGQHSFVLGLLRGVGAIMGILGTYAFSLLQRPFGLVWASFFSIWLQFLMLLPAALAFIFPFPFLDIFLLSAVTFSRIGLYAFDVGEVQLMQRMVPQDQRGTVNSLQKGLCNLMVLCAFGCGLIIHQTKYFGFLIFISVASIGTAAILYSLWALGPAQTDAVKDILRRGEVEKRRKKADKKKKKMGNEIDHSMEEEAQEGNGGDDDDEDMALEMQEMPRSPTSQEIREIVAKSGVMENSLDLDIESSSSSGAVSNEVL